MTATRRLAAILAADVAGYSRLMGTDEEGTHEHLKAHLRELVEPKIAEHRGRTVKNTGDGFLAEFPSVVDAVRCAVEVQRGMIDRESEMREEHRIRFRIGINLGDVIVEPHDIFGDGVNVAARLEALAEPGGICVSRMVRDNVRDKLDLAFEDMGEKSVKNIARPVRVYAVRPERVTDLATAMVPDAASLSQPAAAPRLSIVVLPFTNLSDDREQQYFADGITEDLTTDLSRIENMFVISRGTAFTYKDKPVNVKQIGRELSVRYVLEGSVRRSGNQVRVNAQLIDAATAAHLWADRFQGDTGDLFVLQDEITSRIGNALGVELINAEAARPVEKPDTLDYILRGRAAYLKPPSREGYADAITLFDHALAINPQSVEAQTNLAGVLVNRVTAHMTASVAADLARAEWLVDRALAASPRTAYAHYVKGTVLRWQNQWYEAISEFETALTLNRNLVGALQGLGRCKLYTGSIEEVIPLAEQAMRLDPRNPHIGWRYLLVGTVHLLQSRIDEAIVWLEKARSAMPTEPFHHSWLASLCAQRQDCARYRRTRGSPEAGRRKFFFEHRPREGGGIVGGAKDPRPVRSHLFRRPAQGRDAGRMTATRRLTAILAADVAGYSRLMGADEEGTHERLKAHLRELVEPKIGEHRGRIVKNTGDGFLAEFASVVDAVRCAVEVQRGMAERNATNRSGERIEFRIGINLGDVIVEEHDIFGDGVNVAARLEALAETGGICISRVVRDQIRDKLPLQLEDLGEREVKNIARPVRGFGTVKPAKMMDNASENDFDCLKIRTVLSVSTKQEGPAHSSRQPALRRPSRRCAWSSGRIRSSPPRRNASSAPGAIAMFFSIASFASAARPI
jgi:class 3 adenylate cyclase/TolB-like protein